MPPKKAASRKAPIKVSTSSVDHKVFNNGEKEVAEDLTSDAKIFSNGTSLNDAEDVKESIKSKATKRGGGRVKNVAAELDVEALPSKKPASKGRGKKNLTGNEVIENEYDSKQPASQEVDETKVNNEKVKTKPKGNDGGEKAAPKTTKASKAKKNKKDTTSAKDIHEEDSNKGEEVKLPEKNTKAVSGRKKNQEIVSKIEEQTEIKDELVDERDKLVEIAAEVEPQQKKGRIVKKEKLVKKEKDQQIVAELDEGKSDVSEKKPAKRGRNAAKTVIPAEESTSINGDNEEVLPKKRTRKAPSIEKDIVKEKPKRGRAKKTDKLEEEIIEKGAELNEKEEAIMATNGELKQDKTEGIGGSTISNESTAPAPAAATKSKGGRKRVAPSTNNKKSSKATAKDGDVFEDNVDNIATEVEADGSKSSKTKRSKTDSALVNATATKYNKADFDLPPPSDGQTADEPRFNLKISSWNVAGLRSWLKKDGLKFLDYEQPDIFCMQETKCANDQLPEEVVRIQGYHPYWLCMPGGYAGVAIYSKIMPINVEYGIGDKGFDECGRIITAEYEKFFLVNVYVPNSSRKLVNLEARMKWENLFQQFVQNLDARKPVVICGDMNVSHQEIDLANPKANTRNAGFTKEERGKMTDLLALGYIDTFRHLYPDRKGAYTYWTYMANARSRNVGWRLDYFIVSERFMNRVVDNCIRSQCMGSDHCPITLFLKL